MTNLQRHRDMARFVWVAGVCLLLLVVMTSHAPAGHGMDWVPYLLVPVFLFAMVVAYAGIGVEFVEGFVLAQCASRSCLFQRPPPAAHL